MSALSKLILPAGPGIFAGAVGVAGLQTVGAAVGPGDAGALMALGVMGVISAATLAVRPGSAVAGVGVGASIGVMGLVFGTDPNLALGVLQGVTVVGLGLASEALGSRVMRSPLGQKLRNRQAQSQANAADVPAVRRPGPR